MAQVTLRNTKGTPLTYTEVDNNFKFCDSDTNLIINGGLNIWQRGTTFTSADTNIYTADRFRYNKSGSMVQDILRSTDVPTQSQTGVKANYSLYLDVTTADTSIATTDFTSITYTVEGYDYAQVEGNTYTISFWVKGTKTGIHCISFRNSGTDRSYVAEYTINSTNTWEYKTITVTFDYSGGTWNYTNGIGIAIIWTLAAGSNFQTTANTWQAGNFFSTSNQVNALDSTSNDFRIALVKFEPGVEATQFRFRHIGKELSICQRYFFKTFPFGTTPAQNAGLVGARVEAADGGGAFQVLVQPPTTMRGTPTLTFYNPLAANNQARNLTDSTDRVVAAAGQTSDSIFGASGGSDAPSATDRMAVHLVADAEL